MSAANRTAMSARRHPWHLAGTNAQRSAATQDRPCLGCHSTRPTQPNPHWCGRDIAQLYDHSGKFCWYGQYPRPCATIAETSIDANGKRCQTCSAPEIVERNGKRCQTCPAPESLQPHLAIWSTGISGGQAVIAWPLCLQSCLDKRVVQIVAAPAPPRR